MKRCPMCANCVCTVTAPKRRRKRKAGRVQRTISVSRDAHAWMKAAAEAMGMSVRQLVEAALEGVG